MAPSVSTSRRREAAREQAPRPVPVPVPAQPEATPQMALLDERQQEVRAMIRELHQKLTENSTDVGESFPSEARRMQAGEAPSRSIHGRASLEEAKALIEDGIPLMPLPHLPDEFN